MAKKKNIPITERDTVLCTQSGVYYTCKGERFDRNQKSEQPYKNLNTEQYFKQRVCANLNNPILIYQGNGYWRIPACTIEQVDNHIEINYYLCQNTVKDYKEDSKFKTYNGYNSGKLIVYKDGTAVRLHHIITPSGKIIYYAKSLNSRSYERLEDDSLSSASNHNKLQMIDDKGKPLFCIAKDIDNIDQYYHVKSNKNCRVIGMYDGFIPDLGNNKCFPVKSYEKQCKDLDFAESTKSMLKSFFGTDMPSWSMTTLAKNYYQKYNKESIDNWTDLLNLLYCSNDRSTEIRAEKQKEKLENLISELDFTFPDAHTINIDRVGSYVVITELLNANKKVALIINTTTGKKKFLISENNSNYKSYIASVDIIKNNFVTGYGNGSWNSNQKINPFQVNYLKPFEEVWANTNIGLIYDKYGDEMFSTYESYKYNSHSNWCCSTSRVVKKFKQIINPTTFSMLGIELICSQKDVVCEQLIKSNNIHILKAILETGGMTNNDHLRVVGSSSYRSQWNSQMEVNLKGKNAKEVFMLTNKQLKIVDEYCANSLAQYYGSTPQGGRRSNLIPALWQFTHAFNTQLNTIDLESFQILLNYMASRATMCSYYECVNFNAYTSTNLRNLTSGLTIREIIKFISKFPDGSEYEDYLVMRKQLEALAARLNRPELWDPKTYVVKPRDCKQLHHLHDYVSDIISRYQNAARAAAFDKALERVKDLEWKNDKEELCIIPPKTISDLTREGSTLHHCVGSFVEPISNGTTNVLFIRKKDDIDTPYFTMEILNDGTIRQVHGACNSNPTSEIIEFLLRWARAHKNQVVENSIKGQYGALCANRL